VLGDVSEKGLRAAMVAAAILGSLRGALGENGLLRPGQLLSSLKQGGQKQGGQTGRSPPYVGLLETHRWTSVSNLKRVPKFGRILVDQLLKLDNF
jgi:hypothetical protein